VQNLWVNWFESCTQFISSLSLSMEWNTIETISAANGILGCQRFSPFFGLWYFHYSTHNIFQLVMRSRLDG